MPSRNDRLDNLRAEVEQLARDARLNSWNEFVESLEVPLDLFPALTSSRPELLAMARPRAMTEQEVAILYKLIGGLMETNFALRTHAERLAQLVDNWADAFRMLAGVGRQIQMFANFNHDQVADAEVD